MRQYDYTDPEPWAANTTVSSVSLVVETSEAKITFSIPKVFYEIGDTIEVRTKISNTGRDVLLVIDTTHFTPRAGAIPEHGLIFAGLSIEWDAHRLLIQKLMKLNRRESVTYLSHLVIDSSILEGQYKRYEIECTAICWIYDSDLEYLVQEDRDVLEITGFKDAHILENNTRRFGPFTLEVDISR